MEAQSFLFGFCSNPSLPVTQNAKGVTFPTSPSSFYNLSSSNIHSPKWVSFKSHHSFTPLVLVSKKSLQCKNSVERAEISYNEEKDLESTIRRKNLAVFVSGGGSNFRSIHEATISGAVHGDIVVLVTNKSGCGGAEYARSNGIPVVLFPETKDEPKGLSPDRLVNVLRRYMVDFILLAGYLKLIPSELVRAYPKSILNIHPSLLPAFGGKGYYGMKVHKAVIASGARYSGPSIHFVDEHYDTGRILAQGVVPVLAADTSEDLAARVLKQEHLLYVEVVSALCEERIVWREDGVPLIQSKENPDIYT